MHKANPLDILLLSHIRSIFRHLEVWLNYIISDFVNLLNTSAGPFPFFKICHSSI
jgi:hypothetical protein